MVDAVGYRVVHPGARLDGHQRITDQVLKDLEQAVAFAPLHDPAAIALIREMMKRFPACSALCVLRHGVPSDHAGAGFHLRYTRLNIAIRACADMDSMGFPAREWSKTCGLHQREDRRVFRVGW